jgi:hypothetical protein
MLHFARSSPYALSESRSMQGIRCLVFSRPPYAWWLRRPSQSNIEVVSSLALVLGLIRDVVVEETQGIRGTVCRAWRHMCVEAGVVLIVSVGRS